MFIDYLVDIMTGDPSINDLATGGIKYDTLGTNFNTSQDWIVFDYAGTGEDRTIDIEGLVSYYGLQVQAISMSMNNVLLLRDLLKTYLSTYDDGENVRVISFVNDDLSFDAEFKVHYATLNFDIIFVN